MARQGLGKSKWYRWALAGTCLLVSACSSHTPAPVTSLNKDYASLERGSFRGSYYQVQKGDTLYFISYITGRDVSELVAYNNLSKPYTIFPGQRLQLWKPRYVAPEYGKRVEPKPPVVKAKPKPKAKPVAPKPVVKPTPVVKPAPVAVKPAPKPTPKPTPKPKPVVASPPPQKVAAKPQPVQKNINKNIDPAPTKEYSQKPKSNKVVTSKPRPVSNKVASWGWPAKGRVIARFSSANNGNKGIDIAGQRGQAINAAAGGVVVYAGNALRGYGNLVIIKHSDDYLSAYAHNDQLFVKEQQPVKAGQKIASMGSSGSANVKLHFEIRYKGKSVDPMRYLPR